MLNATLSELEALHTKLVEIKNYPSREDRFGICRLVKTEHRHICASFWINWEHYSGVRNFPIPSTNMSPERAYFKCKRWSKKSKYGQMRYKLLDYLIEQTELKIKELL